MQGRDLVVVVCSRPTFQPITSHASTVQHETRKHAWYKKSRDGTLRKFHPDNFSGDILILPSSGFVGRERESGVASTTKRCQAWRSCLFRRGAIRKCVVATQPPPSSTQPRPDSTPLSQLNPKKEVFETIQPGKPGETYDHSIS